MTTLTFPDTVEAAEAEFYPIFNTQTSGRSPLSRSGQTRELPGMIWGCRLTWPTLNDTRLAELAAFVMKMRGASGRVYLGPPNRKTQKGTITAGDQSLELDFVNDDYSAGLSPRVDGGSQTGASLATRGWIRGQSGVLLAGDFVAFETPKGRALHMVVADAAADSEGKATLTIEPPLRASPADEAALILATPTCVMRFEDDEQGRWTLRRPVTAALSMTLVEALA